ncbi:hypothetical protein B0H63DRAFT_443648 [Podospora didyma]|uniref:Uncharacterized protein n=1 Tax=Podospora didyma TaxID=330526 RepID=A0AAE0P4W1_9PEZI|nr:hypothetical protein B0H63DRAFT_443648 [Podospora didyma]
MDKAFVAMASAGHLEFPRGFNRFKAVLLRPYYNDAVSPPARKTGHLRCEFLERGILSEPHLARKRMLLRIDGLGSSSHALRAEEHEQRFFGKSEGKIRGEHGHRHGHARPPVSAENFPKKPSLFGETLAQIAPNIAPNIVQITGDLASQAMTEHLEMRRLRRGNGNQREGFDSGYDGRKDGGSVSMNQGRPFREDEENSSDDGASVDEDEVEDDAFSDDELK